MQGDNERWWEFWSGNHNPTPAFSIFASPVQHPIMQFDGGAWTPVSYESADYPQGGLPTSDVLNQNPTLQNQQDVVFDTSAGTLTATLPRGTPRMYLEVSNLPGASVTNATAAQLIGNQLRVAPNAADKIMGDNPITAISAVGTTVTVTTEKPHGLTTSKFVTITGAAPAGYNAVNAQVTGAPAANQFTYTVGALPGRQYGLRHVRPLAEPGRNAPLSLSWADQ